MNIVVCLKQVPDTTVVKIDQKTGTLIRDGVPSIINPEDKHALEAALCLKEKHGGKVTVISMGPPQAKDALREALCMGADDAILITDRAFGGADTLATSRTIASAIRNLDYDIIFGGRQAIDGDTAQVGPQVAEKLSIPQITYAEEIVDVKDNTIIVKRRLERGTEVVQGKLPMLVTVNGSAAPCRPRHAKLTMKYKLAKTPSEIAEAGLDYTDLLSKKPYLKINELSVADIDHDPKWLGMSGSPTKVKQIESVVFTAKESKRLQPTDAEIDALMKELIVNHTIG